MAVPQNVKHKITIWPRNSTPRYIASRTENRCLTQNVDTNVHNSTIHNSQNVEKTQVSLNGWMDKQKGDSPTMEYYAAIKSHDLLIHATTWVSLKKVKEAEHRGSSIPWFRLNETSRKQVSCCQSLVRGGRESDCVGAREFLLECEHALEPGRGGGCTT